MRNRLRNLTITVDEAAAEWARIRAAKEDISVSRLVGRLIEERMDEDDQYERAMREALARAPFLRTDGKYLKRDELYSGARSRQRR